MKRGLLTLVTAAIDFRTGHLALPAPKRVFQPAARPCRNTYLSSTTSIDIFLYTLTVTSFHLIQPHVPD